MGSGASSSRHSRRVQPSNPGTAHGLNQVPMNTTSLGNPERGEREKVRTSFSLAIYDRTNYHIWSLFSRQSDGLMQLNLDPSLKDNFVSCNGAFSDTTGKSKCSFCFPFLVLSCLIALFPYSNDFFSFSSLKKNQSKQNILFPKLSILFLYSYLPTT